MSSNKLHVGTTLWSWRKSGSAAVLCEQAEQAQALGFDSIWLPENHFSGAGAIPSPLTVLAAFAARTQRIQLGCTSYLLPIRHPLQAAEEVAVLDQLSEGRLILGLGRGIAKPMFDAFGVATADKRTLFKTNLELMRSAWRGESVLENPDTEPVLLAPQPVDPAGPPLWVAAFGPLALQQVASLGLPYLASPLESQRTLEDNYRQYHQHVEDGGLAPVATIPVMRTVHVTQSDAQTRSVRRALEGSVLPAMRERAGSVEEWAIVGEPAYVKEKIGAYQKSLNMTHLIVRAGIRGIDAQEQLAAHERLLDVCSAI